MSGAKNCPETPRQKMIGMMYLVLTAMLALNVSSDILKGFSLVDNSLRVSIETNDLRNSGLYGRIGDLYHLNPDKVGAWKDKADVVKKESDELYNYIRNYKIETIRLADGKKTDTTGVVINALDNLDVAGTYALTHGKELREKIENYRAFVIKMFGNDQAKSKTYMKIFNTDKMKAKDGSMQPWEYAIFENQPLAAVATMLTKYQNDVRAAENELYSYFIAQTDASDFRVNKIEAIVIPDSKTVMAGGSFKAKIAVVAIDTTKQPKYVLSDGSQLSSDIVDRKCGSIGSYTFSGKVVLTGNDGVEKDYPFSTDYSVTAPSATIANIDMNVVYRGYTNKMSISVPGVATEKLRPVGEGCTLERSGNMWICKPSASNECNITVFADIEGRQTNMGSQKFRVRTLPDPQAFLRFQDSNGNTVDYTPNASKYKLRRPDLIGGAMVAEYADGMLQASFKISGFTLLISDGRGGFTASQSNGNRFSDAQQTTLRRLKTGSIIIIDKIKVTGAKTTTLSYPPITLP